MQGIPALAQPSAASRTSQPLVVFWFRLRRAGSGAPGCDNLRHPGEGQEAAHAIGGELRVGQESRLVGEDE